MHGGLVFHVPGVCVWHCAPISRRGCPHRPRVNEEHGAVLSFNDGRSQVIQAFYLAELTWQGCTNPLPSGSVNVKEPVKHAPLNVRRLNDGTDPPSGRAEVMKDGCLMSGTSKALGIKAEWWETKGREKMAALGWYEGCLYVRRRRRSPLNDGCGGKTWLD